MTERTFTLSGAAGLHARPASLLVQMANKFPGTEISVVKGEKKVNARSVLAVMSLGAKSGESITITADGPQADEAMAAIAALVEGGFGE